MLEAAPARFSQGTPTDVSLSAKSQGGEERPGSTEKWRRAGKQGREELNSGSVTHKPDLTVQKVT